MIYVIFLMRFNGALSEVTQSSVHLVYVFIGLDGTRLVGNFSTNFISKKP